MKGDRKRWEMTEVRVGSEETLAAYSHKYGIYFHVLQIELWNKGAD